MANVIGGIATSHVPSIGGAIAKGMQKDPYWKPFFDSFDPIHAFLEREKPDVAVVMYNDHGLSHFLDKMPTFAIGAAEEYKNADEGWGIPVLPPFAGHAALSWHLIESLVADEFDITSCQEHLVDHAFSLPLKLMYPDAKWPVRTVPITINSVQHPLPSALRCWKLGQAIGRALESWPGAEKIVVVGTGGLSHQLDGTRAGFNNKEGRLEVKARLNVSGQPKPVFATVCLFWTTLTAAAHCAQVLLEDGACWARPLEIDSDGRLAFLA